MELRTLLASVATTLPPILSALLETIQLLWFAGKVFYILVNSTLINHLCWYNIIIVCTEGDVRLVNSSFLAYGLFVISGICPSMCQPVVWLHLC